MGCPQIGRFDIFLSSKFESLGSWIARSPGTFILFPTLLTLLMGSGLQQFSYASDVFYLFVPVHAKSIEDADLIRHFFPLNSSRHVQGSELDMRGMVEVILVAKKGHSALDEQFWQEAQSLVDSIKSMSGNKLYKLLL